MSVSPEWDQLYRDGKHWSVWPWSDVVSLVHRHAAPKDGFCRVLELGCGAGANIPFFLKLGADYFAIEGSRTAVAALHDAFPDLRQKVVVGNFIEAIPFAGSFDLILDRAALTHNDTAAIQRALSLVFRALRRGGKLIGIDWFSTAHSDADKGRPVDAHTRSEIAAGQFERVGAVHFADRDHLVALLATSGFSLERLDHEQIDQYVPAGGARFAAWNFVAVKP